MACVATPRRWLALAAYAASFALFLAWWATIKPTNDRNWAPDVARTIKEARFPTVKSLDSFDFAAIPRS
jgi:hypothetical protein